MVPHTNTFLKNGMVPNAVLVNSSTLQEQTQYFLDFVIQNQADDGWLGPEVFDSSKPRYLWARYAIPSVSQMLSMKSSRRSSRYPYMFGATQMMEYNTSLADYVVPALYKFVNLANSMLKNGEGLEPWTQTRWEDFVISLQWYAA